MQITLLAVLCLDVILFWRGSHVTDALMHQLRTLVGPRRFISGSVCPSNPFEREFSFASPSKRAAESQNFWRLSNTDAPVCVCIDGPFRPHFARARAKGKRSFRTDRQRLASFRPSGRSISNLQLICPIYRLIWLIFGPIFDRWFARPARYNVTYANEKQLRWPKQWPSTCKNHPWQWPSSVRKPTDLEGTSIAVDIVGLTDEKRRCPVNVPRLHWTCEASKIRK